MCALLVLPEFKHTEHYFTFSFYTVIVNRHVYIVYLFRSGFLSELEYHVATD